MPEKRERFCERKTSMSDVDIVANAASRARYSKTSPDLPLGLYQVLLVPLTCRRVASAAAIDQITRTSGTLSWVNETI